MPLRILTLNQISPRGLERFPAGNYVVGADIADPDAILVRSAELHGTRIAVGVRAIGRAGVGVNNIPVEDMSHRGVPEDLFARADAISVHVPLNDATRALVNEARLALMRPGGAILNFARAAIVDEAAVLAALDAGRLHAYVCDFPNRALKDHPRVITLPHLGASTGEAEENCAIMVVEQVRDFLENGNIRNSVNYPDTVLPRVPNTTRLGVANRNVPNMVGQISTCLAAHGINIADLLNKSRGECAYTLIDADGVLGAELLAEIRAIDGVLSARIL